MTVQAWRRLQTAAVVAIAFHSLAIGILLTFFTRWGLRVGGFAPVDGLFFARQAGVFHLVVAVGYLLEYFRRGSIDLLLVAKSMATAFLLTMMLTGATSWTIWLSMLGDAGMAVTMLALHRRAR